MQTCLSAEDKMVKESKENSSRKQRLRFGMKRKLRGLAKVDKMGICKSTQPVTVTERLSNVA